MNKKTNNENYISKLIEAFPKDRTALDERSVLAKFEAKDKASSSRALAWIPSLIFYLSLLLHNCFDDHFFYKVELL